MSNGGQQSLLKFISTFSSQQGQREFMDHSTSRSRPQTRKPRKQALDYLPSPSSKRKRLSNNQESNSPQEKRRNTKMGDKDGKKGLKKKLSPEMQSLKDKIFDDFVTLKQGINTDMHSLIAPIKASLDILLEVKAAWEIGLKECNAVRLENSELRMRIEKIEIENRKLNNKVSRLEDKLLEGNVIFQGVPESLWEPVSTTKEKVLTALSNTITEDTFENRLDQAKQIPIKDVKRIGRYVPMQTRPILVEFYHKSNAEFLLSNKMHLPKGIYIDRQYSEETEKE